MAIVCIGLACYDEFFFVEQLPAENQKTFSQRFLESGGGPAANAAYLTSLWGLETYLLTSVKNDIYGQRILQELQDGDVNVEYVICNEQQVTPLASIWVDLTTGTRTVVTHRNQQAKKFNRQDFAKIDKLIARLNATNKTHVVLVDGHEPELALRVIQGLKHRIVVMDGGSFKSGMLLVLPYVDYAIVSTNYAEQLLRRPLTNKDLLTALMEIKRGIAPQGIPIITLGEKGGVYYDTKVQAYPALRVKAVDTTGAGDIFHGAFCYGLAQGLSLANCCKLASFTSGISVQKLGVKAAMPHVRQVLELLQRETTKIVKRR
ncbi:carbohydrate kinase family protein [Psittacicella gerlachiana]|uniref:Carbohydrate kinase PfkB domain-containing protein n=1 Tax=Psittacicella gerlachiana TaxID=2028574 RepID=A0A3A1YG97_9GAMM|nr:PfkB family carbohydrate kinase [Psittacicella gerlachiana]RIY35234.1 hypothetical protein CKF59_03950 [Psittacicella gerlachiana]